MLYIYVGASFFDWLSNAFCADNYGQKGRLVRWKNLPTLSILLILSVTIITSAKGHNSIAFHPEHLKFRHFNYTLFSGICDCVSLF